MYSSPARHSHVAFHYLSTEEVSQSAHALRASEGQLHDANESLFQRLAELQRLNEAARESRRVALNLMEDAIQSRQAFEGLNAELREGEERYRTLVSIIADVPWVTDAAGAFTEPQSAWEAYTGQPQLRPAERSVPPPEYARPDMKSDRNHPLGKEKTLCSISIFGIRFLRTPGFLVPPIFRVSMVRG